jgi:hypothetical protein
MKTRLIAAGAAALITGCGGGGGGSSTPASTPVPTPTAAGQYTGATSDNRVVTTTILENGSVYVQYGGQGQPDIFAGTLIGTVQSSGGTLSGGTGTDFNLEGQGANAVTVSGTYTAGQSLDATITYGNGTKVTSHQTHDTYYDQTPTLQAIAGNYSGYARVPGNNDASTFAIDATGRISGSSASGCAFTGTLTPRAVGYAYDVSVQFGAGACAYAGQTATGIAMIWSPKVIHAMVQTSSKAGIALLGKSS